MDNPIGYLGGIETTEYYERKEIKRVELIIYFKNTSKKKYITGIFISTDKNLDLCYEQTQFNCKKVIHCIQKNNFGK